MTSDELRLDRLTRGVNFPMNSVPAILPDELRLSRIREGNAGDCFFVSARAVCVDSDAGLYLDLNANKVNDNFGDFSIGVMIDTLGDYHLLIPDCFLFVLGAHMEGKKLTNLEPVSSVRVVFSDHFADGGITSDDFEMDDADGDY